MTLKAEVGGGADKVRAFDWTFEFKLSSRNDRNERYMKFFVVE